MSAPRVNVEHVRAASAVLLATQRQGRHHAAALAMALEVATMLKSPDATELEKDTSSDAAFTPDERSALELTARLHRAIGAFQMVAQLSGLTNRRIQGFLAEHLAQALTGRADVPLLFYRAEHDAIVVGRYTTAEEAQRHCEVLVSREYEETASVLFEWCVDDETPAGLELDAQVDGEHVSTGYTVTPLEVATAYDPDADE